ncbi:HD-GYP domain-containing protein [Desulfovibrio oxyclinae]|uniref:HD-GYP domain-containing protein n=1 Tax=Desulfovibrio oxyclinae TaxID=63560 RepID=UPI000375928A|nr:HD domain-containing phosphohydrolase [Desulfovibrio oxyclinae]
MPGPREARTRLIRIIRDIAAGNYSEEILDLTGPEQPVEIQEIAEAVATMMVRIEAREQHLQQLNETIKHNALRTVTSIAQALGARDQYTEGHGERVAAYSMRTGRRMGLPRRECENLRVAGLLHDIGKIGFSDRMFRDDDMSPDESMMLEIRSHPQWGFDILAGLEFLGPALEYVHAHHERLDGQGYPRGLAEKEIPLGARIIAVADCFDAITTDRPYQRGRPPEDAFRILGENSGGALDADVVEAFIAEVEENGLES